MSSGGCIKIKLRRLQSFLLLSTTEELNFYIIYIMEKNEKELRVIANNIRNKLSQTYEIIDSIKLYEGMSDTAFRESLGLIKKAIATANNDFLLSDSYWEKSIKEQK